MKNRTNELKRSKGSVKFSIFVRESDITVEYNHVLRSISRGSFFSFIYMLLFCSEVLCFVFEPAACKYWEKKQSLKIKQCHFSKGTKLLWIELNWNKECSFSVPNVKNKKKRKFHILFLREFCVLNCVYVVRRMVFVCTKKTHFSMSFRLHMLNVRPPKYADDFQWRLRYSCSLFFLDPLPFNKTKFKVLHWPMHFSRSSLSSVIGPKL